jgi:hypothetical protein
MLFADIVSLYISNMGATCILFRTGRLILAVNPLSLSDFVIVNAVCSKVWPYRN